jgi:hypothetical protein
MWHHKLDNVWGRCQYKNTDGALDADIQVHRIHATQDGICDVIGRHLSHARSINIPKASLRDIS